MIQDLQESKTHCEEFRKTAEKQLRDLRINDADNIKINILRNGSWPEIFKKKEFEKFQMPNKLQCFVGTFEEWYIKKTNSNRKLNWAFDKGYWKIKAKFGAKSYQLTLSTIQCAIFDIINQFKKVTFEKLSELLQVDEEDLKWELFVLCNIKRCLMRTNAKERNWQEFDEAEVICINARFGSKMKKIDCRKPKPRVKKKGGDAAFKKAIRMEREMLIDCIIVRQMKFKETAPIKDIMGNVGQLVTAFKPTAKMIRTRIKDLQNRKYIKRDAKNPKIFHYMP